MANRKLYNNVTQDAQGRYWSNTTDEDGNDIRVQVMPQQGDDGTTYRAATEVEKFAPGANGLWNPLDLQRMADLGGAVPVGARFAAPKTAQELANLGFAGGGAGPDEMIGLQDWLNKNGKTLQDAIAMGGLPLRWNGDGTVTYDPAAQTQSWSYLNPDDGTFHKIAPLAFAALTGAGLAGVGAAGAGGAAGGAMDMGVGLGGNLGAWGGITPVAAGGGGAVSTIGGLGGLLGVESTGNVVVDKLISTAINQVAGRAANEVIPGSGALVGLAGSLPSLGNLATNIGSGISNAVGGVSDALTGNGINWDLMNETGSLSGFDTAPEDWNLTNPTGGNVGEINFADSYNAVPTLPSGPVTPINTNLTAGGTGIDPGAIGMNTIEELTNSITSGGEQTIGSVGSGVGTIAEGLATVPTIFNNPTAPGGAPRVGGGASTGLSQLLKEYLGVDVDPNTLDLIGKGLGLGLGVYGANQQADASRELFNTYMGMGAPYRAELANLNANPSSFYGSPIFQGALQQGSDALARSLSAKVGNPILNPTALQEMQNYTTRGSLDAYNNRWNQLASAGQLGTSQAANLGTIANQSNANTYNALGAGLQSVFGNQRDYAGEYLDLMRGRSNSLGNLYPLP